MDVEILHERLAVAESAVIKTDERLDALENAEHDEDHQGALIAHDTRLTSLEETLTECVARLQSMEQSSQEAMTRIAEAEVQKAEAEAQSAEAIAEVMNSEPTETEPEVSEGITELETEPENESGEEGQKAPSMTWWEKFLALH